MKKTILGLAVIAMVFTACNDKKKDDDHATHTEHSDHDNHEGHGHDHSDHATPNRAESITKVVQSDVLTSSLDAYLSVKTALQEDNAADAATAAKLLASNFSAIHSQDAEVKEIIADLTETTNKIVNQDIKEQREEFEDLTSDLIELINIVGTDRVLYEQYCPMYDNNSGGKWLSDTEDLSNPLYGASMLKCGVNQNKIVTE